MIILEENSKWRLEAFASELFICCLNLLIMSFLYVHPVHYNVVMPELNSHNRDTIDILV